MDQLTKVFVRSQQKNKLCRHERATLVILGVGQHSRGGFSNLAKQMKTILNRKLKNNQHTSFSTTVKSIISNNVIVADALEKY